MLLWGVGSEGGFLTGNWDDLPVLPESFIFFERRHRYLRVPRVSAVNRFAVVAECELRERVFIQLHVTATINRADATRCAIKIQIKSVTHS